jgi:WD40 repeat protein
MRTSSQPRKYILLATTLALTLTSTALAADVPTPRPDVHAHEGMLLAMAISPDGKTLATAGDDKIVKLWDTATGKPIGSLKGHKDRPGALCFSPDGKLLLSGSDEKDDLRVWDVATQKEKQVITNTVGIRAITFSPDAKTAVTVGLRGLVARDPASWKPGLSFDSSPMNTNSDDSVSKGVSGSVAFLPDGKTIVTGSSDSTIRLWDAATGKAKALLAEKIDMDKLRVGDICILKGGAQIAAAYKDRTIRIWDVPAAGATEGKVAASLKGHKDSVNCLALSTDGKLLISGSSDKTVRIWDIQTRKELAALTTKDSVFRVAISPDAKTFFAGCRDGTLHSWTLPEKLPPKP